MPRATVMPTNAFVWIDNPSVSAFMHNLDCGPFRPRSALSPNDALVILPAKHNRIYCAGSLNPRSALAEDISSGSSLPASYCKG